MIVVSTNIGNKKDVIWRNQTVTTGIFKTAVSEGVFLDIEDVKGDSVIDRRYHGGEEKACYLYSLDHYAFWQNKFPDLTWGHGMFGENLTVEGLDERNIRVGDVFTIGDAKVQVTQPRQPCFKLGIRFNNQSILKDFIETTFSGVYVKVLSPGLVEKGDPLVINSSDKHQPTIAEVFYAKYHGS